MTDYTTVLSHTCWLRLLSCPVPSPFHFPFFVRFIPNSHQMLGSNLSSWATAPLKLLPWGGGVNRNACAHFAYVRFACVHFVRLCFLSAANAGVGGRSNPERLCAFCARGCVCVCVCVKICFQDTWSADHALQRTFMKFHENMFT